MSPPSPQIALDRSLRHIDVDGHLHVEMCNISKANVCPYFGREIPGFEVLGLDADRIYQLYRDPEELKKGAHTFANKPLLMHHIPVTADEPERDLWVGVVGGPVGFNDPHLQAPVSVWTQEAINKINSEEQRELSAGYRWLPDMTPGRTPLGIAYDGVMRHIIGNHVALVAKGRAGPDVMVADELPKELWKMKFGKVMAALAAILPSITHTQAVALDSALADEVAKDANPAPLGLSEDEMKTACDAYAKELGKALDALTEEDKTEAYKRAAKDKKKPAMDQADIKADTKLAIDAAVAAATAEATKDLVTRVALDEAVIEAVTAAKAEVHALYAARKAVEPVVGVVAMDSADAVYRFALDHLKVEHKDTAAAGLPALLQASTKAAAPPAIAQDSAAAEFDIPAILGISHVRKG
jgi:hypothetical protein